MSMTADIEEEQLLLLFFFLLVVVMMVMMMMLLLMLHFTEQWYLNFMYNFQGLPYSSPYTIILSLLALSTQLRPAHYSPTANGIS